ncbi:MAG TPA: uroporphyrinogen decarboxylase family protein [Clostridia bacterium]|nr:MAG: Uroporphyrinogen decarboxylase (URO-D) [Firmicutes bacterium ADurb.Bin146]HOD93868.1 uroporphyrinogen decarboxylase family protein [Clostridia bacterium]HQM39098.1 uroporphyrinogen decarboxylase family protein [Clostridia bacterium]
MNSRERVNAAIHFKPVDKVPLQYNYTPVGYFEHGDKLNELYKAYPDDFGPFEYKEVPVLTKNQLDENGNYHEFKKDEWDTVWEYRIYGIAGIPHIYPLSDMDKLKDYIVPSQPDIGSEQFLIDKQQAVEHKKSYYLSRFAGTLIEKIKALCPDENVYCDMAEGTKEINQLADMIVEYYEKKIQYLLAIDVDGFYFGDDYGTEKSMLLSPSLWRSFFKPRWERLFEPIRKANKNIHFHSCGYVLPILQDLAELGVHSIWPQLPAYDMVDFAKYCRSLKLAVAIHTDRANVMTFGTPSQVKDLVKREYEVFRMQEGGSWFYVEADNGFPFENMKALVETIASYR